MHGSLYPLLGYLLTLFGFAKPPPSDDAQRAAVRAHVGAVLMKLRREHGRAERKAAPSTPASEDE